MAGAGKPAAPAGFPAFLCAVAEGTSLDSTAVTPPAEAADRVVDVAKQRGREVHVDGTWASVQETGAPLPGQGWKLHISARPGTLEETLDRALPILLEENCAFKVARSAEVLRELNSGDQDPAVVGKALTVYPHPAEVVRIGHKLAEALAGLTGPRVASDRRVRPGAPVYYRYGPFQPQFRVDENGQFELVVIGPDGQTLPGAAGLEFSCPPWTADPFRPDRAAPSENAGPATGGPVIGGRYRLTSGVIRGPRGNIYRATDAAGRALVVKEARAYVGEHADGTDLRLHLRNELRILRALDGVAGVPQAIDHFRHGDDEYLVTTDAGTRNLHRFVGEYGLFRDDPQGTGRDLGDLAAQLIGVLDAVHARGVVVRDLSPKNVVIDGNGRCSLIDFGISSYEGFQVYGWTPGYSAPGQSSGRPAEPADDYFSLGATLYFAATGMNPVIMGADLASRLERTLMALERLYPPPRAGVCALLPGLLSQDAAERTAAAASLRARRPATPGYGCPAGPRLTPGLLAEVIEHTVAECVRFARELMAGPGDASRTAPPSTSVQYGSAGLGMELLHHAEGEHAALALARWTVEAVPPAPLPASLYFGRTGTAIFLATARRMGAAGLPVPPPVELGEEGGDYLHGVSGIGTGHLILHALEPDAGHLTVAAECARRLVAGQVSMPHDMVEAPPSSGVALETGYAHGLAGTAAFLLAYHQASGDATAGAAASERFAELAGRAERLTSVLHGPDARPMGASWCQGMAGTVSALVRAADAYGGRYLDLAAAGARACLALAPQAWVLSQCCGLAGIGEAMIDVALATGAEEFWQAAREVGELILIRSGGPFARPEFPGNALDAVSPDWGIGSPGVLSFLRRLHRRSGARLWTAEWAPPR
jgi:tRNA A-37 threonylcarbamoyl transferase component Bud32